MFDFENRFEAHGPTRLLSISGGGLLGVIPAAMLKRYEALGQEAYGQGYRLCNSFDSVAGTSTGAVIAAGIALGLSAQDITNFYLKDVPHGFKRRARAIPLVHDLFDGDLMEGFFEGRTEGRGLDRDRLHCDLTLLAKDMTRGNSIAFTTLATQQKAILGVEIRREAHSLSKLLRASTAAPGLFSPVMMALDGLGMTALADGGFSMFNDPSYLLSRLAIAQGVKQIDLTVLGTGSSRPTYSAASIKRSVSITRSLRALIGLIKDGEKFTESLLHDLIDQSRPDFTLTRHDMSLSQETFAALAFPVAPRELRAMRKFADFAGKERLFEAASILAERTIKEALPLARGCRTRQVIDTPASFSANCNQMGLNA